MLPFTLDRKFLKQNIIDEFSSIIWTERYYGDSEVEMVVPATSDLIAKLPVGVFLGIDESEEVMILETVDIDEKQLKVKGISLLKWLNNRFLRTTAAHEDRYAYFSGLTVGHTLWFMVDMMCVAGSPYLDGTYPMGVPNPEQFVIPGLGLKSYDSAGDPLIVGVPFGPLYDSMREIATTYEVGMRITLESADDVSYSLGFESYRGVDRTSRQSINDVVRFSPQMESFSDIKEIQSIASLKTQAYAFAPGNPDGLATTPGISVLTGEQYNGFDLRAILVFADDITTDQVSGSSESLLNILNARAHDALMNNTFIKGVDGEIVSESQLKYGVDYNLGDLIEVQGNSGVIQISRVTEYIRSHDRTGEKAYPTVIAAE